MAGKPSWVDLSPSPGVTTRAGGHILCRNRNLEDCMTIPTTPTENFRVPSTGAHGQSAKVDFRMAPEMRRKVAKIVESRLWPYENASDVYRHALDRHFRWLETQSGGMLDSEWIAITGIMEFLIVEEEHMVFDKVMERTHKLVMDLLVKESRGDAHRVVHGVIDKIASMPEGETRNKYITKMYSLYPDMLTGGRASVSSLKQVVSTTPVQGPASLNPLEASPAL